VDDGERDGRPARPRGRRGAAGKGGAVDVVVVGAGVGGLSAAAELGRAGLSVLVLEREAHAGGTAGCYRRRGFSFPMGPLGFSSPRLVRAQLARLGADDGLSFRHVGYEVRAYGLRTTISQPQAQLAAELKRRFPDEAEGIEGFFALTRRLAGALRSPAPAASAPAQPSAWRGTSAIPALAVSSARWAASRPLRACRSWQRCGG
jgi:phytoene dehydrogenase-like protein